MKRKDVPLNKKWKIEDLFSDVSAWEKTYAETDKKADLSSFSGKLGTKEGFLSYNKAADDVSRIADRLYVYAHMLSDQDTSDEAGNRLEAKAIQLFVKINTTSAYVPNELLSLPTSVLESYKKDDDLKDYRYVISLLLKQKEHVLSEKEETILSNLGEVTSSFENVFSKIDDADFPVKEFTYKGKKYPLSHGTYGVYMQSPDRGLRQKAYETYYDGYGSLINTISATYYGNVLKDVFYAKTKKFPSCLSMALSSEDVDESVYKRLVQSVNDSLPLLHRYMRLKKKELKVPKLKMYDMSVPVVRGVDLKYDYETAYQMVITALAPLGKDYQALLKKAYDERWIDVEETENKRSGAYSTGCYDVHPYVLLNYQPTTHEVFTIAHEMGHAIHSYKSNAAQPFATANYRIFVAEVASTVNEVLLQRYLMANVKDEKMRKYLRFYFLEMVRTTLFRQTQFAEFEETVHRKAFEGEPLTKEEFCRVYKSINEKYYGEDVESDERIATEWARIPHFYSAFYVYKYATGITAALSIAERIITEGDKAVKDYFRFLSSGAMDSPVELLKLAGVDLTKEEPFRLAMRFFEDVLAECEKGDNK